MIPKLVIFDCDGVLVDTESLTDQAISNYFSAHGLHISPSEIHALFSGGTLESAGLEAIERGAIVPDCWLADLYEATFVALRKGVAVFDGVIALLDVLDAAGVKTAVASNGPMAKMEISVGPSGLWDRLSGRIYSRENYAPKPAPTCCWQHAATLASCQPRR